MGKLSFSGILVRIAKIFFVYFYFGPMLFGFITDAIVDVIMTITKNDTSDRFFWYTLVAQVVLSYVASIILSVFDGYNDSFYGRYSLKLYSLITVASTVIYIVADPIIKSGPNPRFNANPLAHIIMQLGPSYQAHSMIYFIVMGCLIILCYYLGRRRALYENAEAVYKTEKSIAEEEAQKKVQKTAEQNHASQVEQRKTGTWRDSVKNDE